MAEVGGGRRRGEGKGRSGQRGGAFTFPVHLAHCGPPPKNPPLNISPPHFASPLCIPTIATQASCGVGQFPQATFTDWSFMSELAWKSGGLEMAVELSGRCSCHGGAFLCPLLT